MLLFRTQLQENIQAFSQIAANIIELIEHDRARILSPKIASTRAAAIFSS